MITPLEMEEKIFTQTGLASVLVYLLDHDGCNQKTLINNTRASTITIYRIQNTLLEHGMITMKTKDVYNQNLYYLTDKGRQIAELFKQIYDIIM